MKEYIYTIPSIEDLITINSLLQEVVKNMNMNDCFTWDSDYPTSEIITEDINSGNARCLKHQSVIIGYIARVTYDKETYREFDCEHSLSFARLMIKPSYQQNGFAQIIVEHFLTEFSEEKYTNIDILVDCENLAACKLYEKMGFRNVGETLCPWGAMLRYQLELS